MNNNQILAAKDEASKNQSIAKAAQGVSDRASFEKGSKNRP